MFDEEKTRDFYLGFLGFNLNWEHRFGDDFPLFMQVSRDDCILELSEHHGDACPGASIHVRTTDLDEFVRGLVQKGYKYSRPGIQEMEWGDRQTEIKDPAGNKIIFFSPKQPV